MLKLVYTAEPIEPLPAEIVTVPVEAHPLTPFEAKVVYKGPNLYEMQIQDYSHYLTCDLTLEVEQDRDKRGPNVVVCHLPKISDEQLNAFIWEDETLYAITMIQFQMRLLKELLLFCTNHYVEKLEIYVDEEQAEDFGIYQDFLIYEEQIESLDEGLTKMIIPVNAEICEDWADFMSDATLRFQQTLWQNQRKNPAVRHYLKSHPFSDAC